MRKAIFLMLFCGSANAGMYSCVDDSGKKVLRSEPCEQNEKQQPIVIKAPPSYYAINSTGEKHGVESYQAKQVPKTVAQSAAQKNTTSLQPKDIRQSNWDKAVAFATEQARRSGDPNGSVYRSSLALALRGLNGETTPPDNPAPSFNPAPTYSTPEPPAIPPVVTTAPHDTQINIYDQNSNFSYGNIDGNGQVHMYDQNGNYSYGNVNENGQIYMYDQNGNYSYGNVNENGQVNMYDQNGNYSYGEAR